MQIIRKWAMPNKNTFDIKPIKDFITKVDFNNKKSIDPFANKSKIANITNDLNPEFNCDYCLSADKFLKLFSAESIDIVLYDPPFSSRQMKEAYNSIGINFSIHEAKSSYLSACKKEIERILKPGGICLSFGWNTNGIGGKTMKILEILIVAHGGLRNDTLCVMEKKIQGSLR
jgi:hypothetical protein